MPSEELLITFVALPIICGSLIAMTAIITEHKRKSLRDDMDATLKMEMLQRGMSAEDIERVLTARTGGFRKRVREGEGQPSDAQRQKARGCP